MMEGKQINDSFAMWPYLSENLDALDKAAVDEYLAAGDTSNCPDLDTREFYDFAVVLAGVYVGCSVGKLIERCPYGTAGQEVLKICQNQLDSTTDAVEAATLYFALNHQLDPTQAPAEKPEVFVPLKDIVEEFKERRKEQPSLPARALVVEWLESSMHEASTAIGDAQATRNLTTIPDTENYYMPTAKVFWEQRDIARKGTKDIVVDNTGNPLVKASIKNVDGSAIELTPLQILVELAVYQIARTAGLPFTVSLDQIINTAKFFGKNAGAKVADTTREEFEEAIDSLMFKSDSQLDFTRQVDAHGLKRKNPQINYLQTTKRSSLLFGTKHTDTLTKYKGKTIKTSYTIYELPLYCEYSEKIRQIATIKAALIAPVTDEKAGRRRTTSDTAVLRVALVRHVERIKSSGKIVPRITFSKLLEDCGAQLYSEKQQRSFREEVRNILEDFKKTGYIKGYEVVTQRQKYIGYDIRF